MKLLFQSDDHRNVMFEDLTEGAMVQANQHLVIHNGEGLLLDPGGHKVYTKLLASMSPHLPPVKLKHLFFSHQDPDIIASANGWLLTTDAQAYLSEIWMRFIPHFGIDSLVIKRIQPIPDAGGKIVLGGVELKLIPAHFLHSPGNFQVYDPVAKILYSGDLGASPAAPQPFVEDFDAHVKEMEGFHRRYMPSPEVFKKWAAMARTLDLETIAPQHGAIFKGPAMVKRFIDWIDQLPCGPSQVPDNCRVP